MYNFLAYLPNNTNLSAILSPLPHAPETGSRNWCHNFEVMIPAPVFRADARLLMGLTAFWCQFLEPATGACARGFILCANIRGDESVTRNIVW